MWTLNTAAQLCTCQAASSLNIADVSVSVFEYLHLIGCYCFRALAPERKRRENVQIFKELHYHQGKVIRNYSSLSHWINSDACDEFLKIIFVLLSAIRISCSLTLPMNSGCFVFWPNTDQVRKFMKLLFFFFFFYFLRTDGSEMLSHQQWVEEHPWFTVVSPQLLTTATAACRRLGPLWEPSPPSSTTLRPTWRVSCSVCLYRKPFSGRGNSLIYSSMLSCIFLI